MKYKRLKIWLRKHGMLCRQYEYKAPKKLKISRTVWPNGSGPTMSPNGTGEFYGVIGDR